MTTQQDCSVGIKKETVYGTAVTVDRHVEFLTADFDWQPAWVGGQGLRVGSRVERGQRRQLGQIMAGGSLSVEAFTRGLGILFEAAFGAGVSTQISGTSYQQVYSPAISDNIPSYTIQVGTPPVGGGNTVAQTIVGAMCNSIEFAASVGALLTINTDWSARDVSTAPSYAAPTYPASGELFTFIHGSLMSGGTFIPPTSTALAQLSGGTALGDVTAFSLKMDNHLDSGGFVFGSNGRRGRKQVLGQAEISGSITAEFDSVAFRDAFLNQSDLTLLVQFQTSTIISGTNKPTLQLAIPLLRLNGEMPKPKGGNIIEQTLPFIVLDNGTQLPLYVVAVTADSTI